MENQLDLEEQLSTYPELNGEFETFDFEESDWEWEAETRSRRSAPSRRSLRRPRFGRPRRAVRGRRPRLARPWHPKPRPKPPTRPGTPKPRPPKGPTGPIIMRPRPYRRRRPLVIREPAAPCTCPAHGTEFVRWVQSSLNRILGLRLRVNGVMNRITRKGLRDFQKREGLPVDGIAGPETEQALVHAKKGPLKRSPSVPARASEIFDDLELDLEGWEPEVPVNRKSRTYIRWVQRSLNKVMGANLKVDGISGRRTRSVIRSFQRRYSLTVDGIVGPQTEAMLTTLGFSVPQAPQIPIVPASGDWVMPPSVRAAGEAQYVRYDSPPSWAGKPGNCTANFTSGSKKLKEYILSKHPGVSRIGGYNCRVNTANRSQTSVHGVGRALDIMIRTVAGRANSAVGDPIANWLVKNAEPLGVQYIIWNRTKWNGSKRGSKHGRYGGPSPHTDHIHVELNRDGAARRTAWFNELEFAWA